MNTTNASRLRVKTIHVKKKKKDANSLDELLSSLINKKDEYCE